MDGPIKPVVITKYNARTNDLVYLPAFELLGELVECHYTDAYPTADTAMEVAEAFVKAYKEKEL